MMREAEIDKHFQVSWSQWTKDGSKKISFSTVRKSFMKINRLLSQGTLVTKQGTPYVLFCVKRGVLDRGPMGAEKWTN